MHNCMYYPLIIKTTLAAIIPSKETIYIKIKQPSAKLTFILVPL
jgi:hypothetical protein